MKIITNVVDIEAMQDFIKDFDIPEDLVINIEKGSENKVIKNGKEVLINVTEPVYAFRLMTFLIDNYENLYTITEKPSSNKLTFYTDCSRNGVINFKYFKKLIKVLAAEGYNRIGLYTEDTFEVNNEPYFGHLRGRFTKNEIKQMDAYAKKYGIELIPAIATLAHLDNIFFWSEYEKIFDLNDIILVEDPRTNQLLENIFQTLAECYTSREVHIGFDEAHYALLGRYFDQHGVADRTAVILKYLRVVLDIAKKYGFHCSAWSDMFFRLEYGEYHPSIDKPGFSNKILSMIPEDLTIIYWDYYNSDQKIYDKMFERHLELSKNVAFAGGCWNWLGYAPMNRRAFNHSIPAIKSCKKYNINEIYVTAWGDNGNECSRGAIMPTIFLFGEYVNAGFIDKKYLSERIKTITGLTLNDFNSLDLINDRPGNIATEYGLSNPAKYLVYNDPLNGVFDYHISDLDVIWIKKALNAMKKVNYQNTMYELTFKTEIALCNFLIKKATIGNDIYNAYKNKDIQSLTETYKKRIPLTIKKFDVFYNLLREQWYFENKTFGFEVLQVRLGGLKMRLEETQRRLKEYCLGEIERIEELEQPKLSQKYPWEDDRYVYKHNYKYIANVFMNK